MVDTKSYFAISANGNPLSLRRSGLRQDGTFGLIDDLALSYDMYQPNIKVMFNRVNQH